jgi:hypothetical protein
LRYFNKRAALIVLKVISFVALFPLSVRLADPFFTQPFQPNWIHPVLLIWSDHAEVRWFSALSEVSPRAAGAGYSFIVPPEQESWVKAKVRATPSPNGNAGWIIHLKQLGPAKQEIQLELLGDGITGIIYEATPNQIKPLRTRRAGPGGALVVLLVNLSLWGGIWIPVWLVTRLQTKVNVAGRAG